MNSFAGVEFRGRFRDYQQRVLDNAQKYLDDGRINIVAAPGSGKTVLGLELIRRLGKPCIILSPTTAIRRQWGERFKEMFLPEDADFSSLFSGDLHNVKLVNSVTYQALYTAVEKKPANDDGEIDCSDVDIFAEIRRSGIGTVCLDEAHHLKNEWQRALEKFISSLDPGMKIISLTATPPYDSDSAEWNRYMTVCGEIDEEISVPELVGQNTLCPHQDYVYFNYPTDEETDAFCAYKERAAAAIGELGGLELFSELCSRLNGCGDYETLFSDVKGMVALAVLLRHYGLPVGRRLVRELTVKKELPAFNMRYAEDAIRFLLDGELLTEDQKTGIVSILKSHSVYEKKRVTLDLSEPLKRALISSVGKLQSIKSIAENEAAAMGERLRMLVLTDYIKKESLSGIAAAERLDSVNVVSIFETLRRAGLNVKIGVLSGSLVILPRSAVPEDEKCRSGDIPGTEYCTVEFAGALHHGVEYVGRLFAEGGIQILVGTKSLLGEGWDSPCINSLILASFVGSFVLSNQMRGRAIRIDKNDPDKTANIWHLVTVEPEYIFKDNTAKRLAAYAARDKNELVSCDYEVLKRRFDSFLGPNYSTGEIESGIGRITAVKPPYNKRGIDAINAEMLKLSADRGRVKDMWRGEVSGGSFAVEVETELSRDTRVPVFTFRNFGLLSILSSAEILLINGLVRWIANGTLPLTLVSLPLMICFAVMIYKGIKRLALHVNPARSIKTLGRAVFRTLCECGVISPSARVTTAEDKELYSVALRLTNASIHDQNVFNAAMAEMLSPIENPRYLLIAKTRFGGYNYRLSFACPSVIGKKREFVDVLAEKLRASTGHFDPVYAHREDGRKLILKCRKRSYITFNERAAGRKYKVSHFN